MNRRLYQWLTWLMWLVLPLTAFQYLRAWDRLPARLATHFNAAGQPNGWMTREAALEFGLGMTVLFLVVFTVASYFLQKQKLSDAGSWPLLGLFAVMVGVIYQGNVSIIDYNLTGRPISMIRPFLFVPLVIILLAIYLGAKRGRVLPATTVIAEERHASLSLSLILIVLAGLAVFNNISAREARLAAIPIAVVLALCAAFTWSGFEYRFSPAGVEIRTLGFRLRSIPAADIRNYAIEAWSLLRGYGIRGVGGSRAYVWGNKVVHIQTAQGDVYLGHDDPERIVRDLEMITRLSAKGGSL